MLSWLHLAIICCPCRACFIGSVPYCCGRLVAAVSRVVAADQVISTCTARLWASAPEKKYDGFAVVQGVLQFLYCLLHWLCRRLHYLHATHVYPMASSCMLQNMHFMHACRTPAVQACAEGLCLCFVLGSTLVDGLCFAAYQQGAGLPGMSRFDEHGHKLLLCAQFIEVHWAI